MTDITQFIYDLKENVTKIGTLNNEDIFLVLSPTKNELDEYPAKLISYGKTTFKFLSNPLEIAKNFKQEIIDIFRKKNHITDRYAIYEGIYKNNLIWQLIPNSARNNKVIVGFPVMLLFNGDVLRYADHDEVLDIMSAK